MELRYVVLMVLKLIISVPSTMMLDAFSDDTLPAIDSVDLNTSFSPEHRIMTGSDGDLNLPLSPHKHTDHKSDPISVENIPDPSPLVLSGYNLPEKIFNGGKPFYLQKNPITGRIDFNSDYSDAYSDKSRHTNPNLSVNQISPNHKAVHPLISSSYANTKFQGNVYQSYSPSKVRPLSSTTTTSTTTTAPSIITTTASSPPATTKSATPISVTSSATSFSSPGAADVNNMLMYNANNFDRKDDYYDDDEYYDDVDNSSSVVDDHSSQGVQKVDRMDFRPMSSSSTSSTTSTTTSTTSTTTPKAFSLFESLFSDYDQYFLTPENHTTTNEPPRPPMDMDAESVGSVVEDPPELTVISAEPVTSSSTVVVYAQTTPDARPITYRPPFTRVVTAEPVRPSATITTTASPKPQAPTDLNEQFYESEPIMQTSQQPPPSRYSPMGSSNNRGDEFVIVNAHYGSAEPHTNVGDKHSGSAVHRPHYHNEIRATIKPHTNSGEASLAIGTPLVGPVKFPGQVMDVEPPIYNKHRYHGLPPPPPPPPLYSMKPPYPNKHGVLKLSSEPMYHQLPSDLTPPKEQILRRKDSIPLWKYKHTSSGPYHHDLTANRLPIILPNFSPNARKRNRQPLHERISNKPSSPNEHSYRVPTATTKHTEPPFNLMGPPTQVVPLAVNNESNVETLQMMQAKATNSPESVTDKSLYVVYPVNSGRHVLPTSPASISNRNYDTVMTAPEQSFTRNVSTHMSMLGDSGTGVISSSSSSNGETVLKDSFPVSNVIRHSDFTISSDPPSSSTTASIINQFQQQHQKSPAAPVLVTPYTAPTEHSPPYYHSAHTPNMAAGGFEAPFQASVNADTKSQGWLVVRRSDTTSDDNGGNVAGDPADSTASPPAITTGRFDFEKFTPELIGGFQPIYDDSIFSSVHTKTERSK